MTIGPPLVEAGRITPWPGRIRSGVREQLADAPIGEHALLEAAFAWQRLRPADRTPTRGPRARCVPVPTGTRHLPVAETDHEEVAVRMARLLSGLTWAVTDRAGSVPQRWSVRVPQATYHRVIRALTSVWRQAARQFEPGRAVALADPYAAGALWRMGLLIDDTALGRDVIRLHTGDLASARLLAGAAGALGVTVAIEEVRRDPVVVTCQPAGVRRLLSAALPVSLPALSTVA